MKDPLSTEQITAVYVSDPAFPDLQYVCQASAGAPIWHCGQCGEEAFGYEPRVGDECAECGAKVVGVRRGPPEPIFIPEHFR